MKNTDPKPTYIVVATLPDNTQATVTHRSRFTWSRATARKHARDYTRRHGHKTEVREF